MSELYRYEADPQFARPYIDAEEWRENPVRHRYVHGGFEGTQSRFAFYFPEKDKFEFRFFQTLTPIQAPEDYAEKNSCGENDMISFAALHGAYLVSSNQGGILNGGGDKTLAYRCSANTAMFGRKVAAGLYGSDRYIYGYVTGGSGGAFKTISAVECTQGVWDGALPTVLGSPMAIPNVQAVRVHAMRLLRNKFPQVVDAIEPGGSSDPYAVLNEEEAAALREAERLGFPMETWAEYETIGDGALSVLTPYIPLLDPDYYSDFWEKEGYLGADPDGSAVRDRIKYETYVEALQDSAGEALGLGATLDANNSYGVDEAWKNILRSDEKLPVFHVAEFPEGDVYARGLVLTFLDGAAKGERMEVVWLGGRAVTPSDTGDRHLSEVLKQVKPGDRVLLDNSDYLAVQTYPRHQVPPEGYPAWDQYRDENGAPIYPQRPVIMGPVMQEMGSGSVENGRPNCKVIILESLMDESAFPWQGDYYRRLVERENPDRESKDLVRLWYMEHCMHTDCEEGNGGDHQHIVSYLGALHQGLLDLSDWVERGIEPALSTNYVMDGAQVIVPKTAAQRGGIQPVVTLLSDGEIRKEIRAGEEVAFQAAIELPKGSGELDEVTWDFEASDSFMPSGTVSSVVWNDEGIGTATAETSFTFTKPGTYFPVIKVASNRNAGDIFTRIRNQARMRVVVK